MSDYGKYGKTDLGAELYPCEICCTVNILSFSKCNNCHSDLAEGMTAADIRYRVHKGRRISALRRRVLVQLPNHVYQLAVKQLKLKDENILSEEY